MNDKVATIKDKLRHLSSEKRRLLIEMARSKAKVKQTQISKRMNPNTFRQSYPQRRLWFLDRVNPSSTMYNMPECARLEGDMDYDIFQKAFDDVVARHESLRVTFREGGEGPVQDVQEHLSIPIQYIDATHLAGESSDDNIRALAHEVADQPFDLINGPVIRMTLIKVQQDLHYFIINMHHIVSDGWSMSVFADDFSRCLESRTRNETPQLPPLPIQYGDFVEWQLSRLSGQELDDLLAFWRPRMDIVEDIQLPFDFMPTLETTDAGGFEYIDIEPELTKKIKKCAEACNVTLYVFLFSLFSVLLYRYSGQSHITMGSPVACRSRPETESLIGFFANTLLVTASTDMQSSFKDVTSSVKKSAMGALEHSDMPFDMLVDLFRPERDMLRNPLFQVMFILQNNQRPQMQLSEFDVSLVAAGSMSVKFEMLMEFYEKGEGIVGWLGYRRELFDASTIARLTKNFVTLAEAVVVDPDINISLISLEPKNIVAAFNDDLDDEF